MRVLMPFAYFLPEQVASTHLDRDMLSCFSENGLDVRIVCPVPTRGCSAEEIHRYAGIRHETMYGGRVTVDRYWAPQEKGNSLLRALRYYWCYLRQARLCAKIDADAALIPSTPPFNLKLAAKLKKKRPGMRILYNLQDIFPDSLVNTGLAGPGSLLWKIGRRMEDRGYAAADRIVVISDDFRQNIRAKGVPDEKIALIRNWVDENAVVAVPREENRLFDEYGLDRDRFYVCYSGNIGHTQNMELLLDVAASLADRPDVGFVIVGDGAYREQVAERIRTEKIGNVTMIPFQPYERISEVFSIGDAGLIISKAGIGGNSVPSKTWSVMSASRPVLASFDKDSELDRVVTGNRCGVCVPPDDPQALRNAILALAEDREGRLGMGRRGRAYIEQNLTRSIGTSKWLDALSAKTV